MPPARAWRAPRGAVLLIVGALGIPALAQAQEADPLPAKPDTSVRFPNTTAGEFTPGAGFDVIATKRGTLNISVYGLFRYITQAPTEQTFTDHLGNETEVNPRNDVNWHRTMIWLSGFFYDPKFRYTITAWGLPTTQQTLVFGNLQYRHTNSLLIGVGIAPTLTARSLQGSWPFWAGSDRQMAEEFFRGGFSAGAWLTGQVVPRLWYTLSVNNNLSQLGVTQANDTRDMAYSASMRWQPTTGEFGPRNGFGDLEDHQRVATQFGFSTGRSRESRYAPLDQPPNAGQIKLSDSVNPFSFGALADSSTVTSLTFLNGAIDAGLKYRGFAFQGEYYYRRLSGFESVGDVPLSPIIDRGFMAEAGYMVVPRKLMLYVVSGYIWDEYKRRPWELGGGLSLYPYGDRSWRINLHGLHVHRSPTSSFFGYYQGGLKGAVISLGTDILL